MGDMKVTFAINISLGNMRNGESEVDFWVTEKEFEMICAAKARGEEFRDVEELSDLYRRVMIAAGEQLMSDLDLQEYGEEEYGEEECDEDEYDEDEYDDDDATVDIDDIDYIVSFI